MQWSTAPMPALAVCSRLWQPSRPIGRSPRRPAGSPEHRWSLSTIVSVVSVLACLAGCLLLLGWRISGGSWAIIQTPSMGTADPVGTLVMLRPALLDDVTIGDVVSYRPANNQRHIYTHRVVAKFLDGTLQVRGDINGAADPLPVAQQDLVGKVVAHLPGAGYLIRALPTLLVGEIVLMLATGYYVKPQWRSSVRVIGCCLLVGIASLMVRPFVHPVLIAVTVDDSGQSMASVVSTGILPTRISGTPGHHISLQAGETGVVPVQAGQAGGAITINGSPDLHGWWLAAMIALSLLPLLWCLTVGLAPNQTGPPAADQEPE